MAKSSSLVALLGLLAVAGFQHRDKIQDALKGASNNTGGGGSQGGLGGVLGGLGDLISGKPGSGNVLTGGLNDLLDSFRGNGQKDTADSWTTVGVPTKGLTPPEVEAAIGRDTLTELSQSTGLSYEELLKRLSSNIPDAVDRLTPDGRFPTTDEEARRSLLG
ncbi:hypothetical protein ASG47_09070 [Devosia sp. Leaf420]|uniref:YidB family protein n=1 Tax=Devosia sp. Leaf420 TaxID=1736374 RepID=UPI000714A1DD|nr:YidB family protein [Devosia sp. Leaf420]KQT48486.1 hypothetical protein ASG47_09070 [Devosia sp. Leaf420]